MNPAHTHPLSLSALVASTLQEPRENRAEMWASSSSLLYDIALSLEREWTEISRIIIHEKKKRNGLSIPDRIRTIDVYRSLGEKMSYSCILPQVICLKSTFSPTVNSDLNLSFQTHADSSRSCSLTASSLREVTDVWITNHYLI